MALYPISKRITLHSNIFKIELFERLRESDNEFFRLMSNSKKLQIHFSFQAEVYVNLLEGETMDENENSSNLETQNKLNQDEQLPLNSDPQQKSHPQQPPEESDEASSVSTLSTIQHITPMATPTKGQSKRTTPQSR